MKGLIKAGWENFLLTPFFSCPGRSEMSAWFDAFCSRNSPALWDSCSHFLEVVDFAWCFLFYKEARILEELWHFAGVPSVVIMRKDGSNNISTALSQKWGGLTARYFSPKQEFSWSWAPGEENNKGLRQFSNLFFSKQWRSKGEDSFEARARKRDASRAGKPNKC